MNEHIILTSKGFQEYIQAEDIDFYPANYDIGTPATLIIQPQSKPIKITWEEDVSYHSSRAVSEKYTGLPEYNQEPIRCPKCKGTSLDTQSFNTDADEAWRDVQCEGCGFAWTETFRFAKWEPED